MQATVTTASHGNRFAVYAALLQSTTASARELLDRHQTEVSSQLAIASTLKHPVLTSRQSARMACAM